MLKSLTVKPRALAGSCARILDAPAGSKLALFKGLLSRGHQRMGFSIKHPDLLTVDQLYYEIFVRQFYFFRTDSEAPAVLDCGANVGVAAMYFKWLYPRSRVQCFEPDGPTFALLQRNIADNRLIDVVAHRCALWDESGEVDFFSDPARPGALSMSTDPSYITGHSARVPACRLSDFISKPIDFLKLDIEGAEHRVLCDLVASGKISLIRRMVVEYHHRMGEQKGRLADFLKALEVSGFEYQFDVSRATQNHPFQSIHIACYRE